MLVVERHECRTAARALEHPHAPLQIREIHCFGEIPRIGIPRSPPPPESLNEAARSGFACSAAWKFMFTHMRTDRLIAVRTSFKRGILELRN
ncbi:MAG TPA: hypothetical protein VD839_01365 [Burkholderiales bacterium]|jgi:hypothetical protein|nr:hypothetical protein [Burkholderiales bacterium]